MATGAPSSMKPVAEKEVGWLYIKSIDKGFNITRLGALCNCHTILICCLNSAQEVLPSYVIFYQSINRSVYLSKLPFFMFKPFVDFWLLRNYRFLISACLFFCHVVMI